MEPNKPLLVELLRRIQINRWRQKQERVQGIHRQGYNSTEWVPDKCNSPELLGPIPAPVQDKRHDCLLQVGYVFTVSMFYRHIFHFWFPHKQKCSPSVNKTKSFDIYKVVCSRNWSSCQRWRGSCCRSRHRIVGSRPWHGRRSRGWLWCWQYHWRLFWWLSPLHRLGLYPCIKGFIPKWI